MLLILLRILLLFAIIFFLTRLVRLVLTLMRSSGQPRRKVPPRKDGQPPFDSSDIVDGQWKELKD